MVGLLGALTPEEQYGEGLLAPMQRGHGLGLLGGIRQLMGPSVMSRMQQADAAQQARLASGERSPTPLTEENMWLADDVAGGMVGPLGMAGIFAGVGAKTANKSALEAAERMAKEGADPRAYKGPYPLDDFDNWWGNRTFANEGGRMVDMTPDEYLAQVRRIDPNEELTAENVKDLVDHVRSGGRLDPLVIYSNGKEDGRHRALAAKMLGYDRVPVLDYRQHGRPRNELK